MGGDVCARCQMGKQTHQQFKTDKTRREKQFLDPFHADLGYLVKTITMSRL